MKVLSADKGFAGGQRHRIVVAFADGLTVGRAPTMP
jgi:hypothetical protein